MGLLFLFLNLFVVILTQFIDVFKDILGPIASFVRSYGEIGLFFYSIVETITPLAGVEIMLVPLISASPDRWFIITLILVFGNAVGAGIVYFFMAKPDNRFFGKIVNKKTQEKAKNMFNRYGIWAIFIFAMTPLPFFIIIFTAAIAKMKFYPYIFAVFFSRGARFLFTTFVMYRSVKSTESLSTGEIVLWLTVIGVVFTAVMVGIQKLILIRIESDMDKSETKE